MIVCLAHGLTMFCVAAMTCVKDHLLMNKDHFRITLNRDHQVTKTTFDLSQSLKFYIISPVNRDHKSESPKLIL